MYASGEKILKSTSGRSIKIGVLMDPLDRINIKKDTTLALIEAAQRKDWSIDVFLHNELNLSNGSTKVCSRSLHIDLSQEFWYQLGEERLVELDSFNCILMRKDPPFNMSYIYSTYFLDRAEQAGVLVVNRPDTLRDCNEKLYATLFPQCCPPLLVSSRAADLKAFYHEHGDVIYKPLDGMGGDSILRARENEPNLSVIIELLTKGEQTPIMAQRYIPEIVDGDKRILMIDGKAVDHCLARVPLQGETRGNLAAGGRGEVRPLSKRDRWIAEQVGPDLVRRGILFAGLDVIGDYLTEINITSPTCVREIDKGAGTQIGDDLMNAIERKINAGESVAVG